MLLGGLAQILSSLHSHPTTDTKAIHSHWHPPPHPHIPILPFDQSLLLAWIIRPVVTVFIIISAIFLLCCEGIFFNFGCSCSYCLSIYLIEFSRCFSFIANEFLFVWCVPAICPEIYNWSVCLMGNLLLYPPQNRHLSVCRAADDHQQ